MVMPRMDPQDRVTPLRRPASPESQVPDLLEGDQPDGLTWAPADLQSVVASLLNGTVQRPEPTLGRRSDGAALLYAGRVNSLISESGGAKTWVALEACRQELQVGHHVVFVDFEDHAEGIVARLLDLGAAPDAVVERFRYVCPQEPFSIAAESRLAAVLVESRPTLVVIDSVGESMALDGIRPNDDDQVARWYRRLPRRVAAAGPAVLGLDHVTKSGEGRGLFAIGSQRKRAAVSGASYMLETVLDFGKGRTGSARLVVAKDRHGTYVQGQTAATFVLGPASQGDRDGLLESRLEAPSAASIAPASLRPTRLMERVSRYVEDHPGASGNDIDRARLGKADYVRKATGVLVTEGWLRVERVGPAMRHRSERPFREDPGACSPANGIV